MTGLPIPLSRLPSRSMSFTTGASMPNPTTTATTADRDEPDLAAASAGVTEIQAEAEERRTRRRRVATVEIPEEIHALATLTGLDPSDIIEGIVKREVTALVIRAQAIMSVGA